MLRNLGSFLCSLPNDTKAASLGSADIKAEMSIKLDGMDPIAATPTFDEASSTSSSSSGEKVRATISLEETVTTCSSDSPTLRGAGADGLRDSASVLQLLFPGR